MRRGSCAYFGGGARSWSATGLDMGVQCIQQAMTRDRFLFILGKLHLNNNNGRSPDNMDKLWKIRPLVEGLNQVFKENKLPMEHLSIDESMIRFKGRCSFKQYNPMKPIKRGYKLWCVADNCGYVYKFEIYTTVMQKGGFENFLKF